MITLPDAAPGVGPIINGAAGPAGGAGPQPAGGPYDAVSDATAAFAGSDNPRLLIDGMAQTAATPPEAPPPANPMPALDRRYLGPTKTLEMALLFVSGILFMLVSSFSRRRHRRRLGWGMLPERSLFSRD